MILRLAIQEIVTLQERREHNILQLCRIYCILYSVYIILIGKYSVSCGNLEKHRNIHIHKHNKETDLAIITPSRASAC